MAWVFDLNTSFSLMEMDDIENLKFWEKNVVCPHSKIEWLRIFRIPFKKILLLLYFNPYIIT